MRSQYYFTVITIFTLLMASSVWSADFACNNTPTCPATVDPCRCDLAEELKLNGPESFSKDSFYTAEGGRPNYYYYIFPEETSAEYIDPKTGKVLKVPNNPDQCPMKITVYAEDACPETPRAEKQSEVRSEINPPLTITGPEEPKVGDVYTASGGVPPYSFNFNGGEIDADTGEILSITTCGGPEGNGAIGIVSVVDQCASNNNIKVRVHGGAWIVTSWAIGLRKWTSSNCNIVLPAENYKECRERAMTGSSCEKAPEEAITHDGSCSYIYNAEECNASPLRYRSYQLWCIPNEEWQCE